MEMIKKELEKIPGLGFVVGLVGFTRAVTTVRNSKY
jgi:hypothetical protein